MYSTSGSVSSEIYWGITPVGIRWKDMLPLFFHQQKKWQQMLEELQTELEIRSFER